MRSRLPIIELQSVLLQLADNSQPIWGCGSPSSFQDPKFSQYSGKHSPDGESDLTPFKRKPTLPMGSILSPSLATCSPWSSMERAKRLVEIPEESLSSA